jgi:hypothetical protein
MTAFFRGMNLARAIMLGSILLSAVLAYAGYFGFPSLGWPGYVQVSEMRDDLDGRVKGLAGDISRLARQHTELTQAVRKEGWTQQTSPESYIRSVASADRVDIGDVQINPRQSQIARDVVDRTWQIKPDPSRSYHRSQIANFLYKLEADSRRIKVTDIRIEKAQKRLKPYEIPDDEWTFEATVTSRQKGE